MAFSCQAGQQEAVQLRRLAGILRDTHQSIQDQEHTEELKNEIVTRLKQAAKAIREKAAELPDTPENKPLKLQAEIRSRFFDGYVHRINRLSSLSKKDQERLLSKIDDVKSEVLKDIEEFKKEEYISSSERDEIIEGIKELGADLKRTVERIERSKDIPLEAVTNQITAIQQNLKITTFTQEQAQELATFFETLANDLKAGLVIAQGRLQKLQEYEEFLHTLSRSERRVSQEEGIKELEDAAKAIKTIREHPESEDVPTLATYISNAVPAIPPLLLSGEFEQEDAEEISLFFKNYPERLKTLEEKVKQQQERELEEPAEPVEPEQPAQEPTDPFAAFAEMQKPKTPKDELEEFKFEAKRYESRLKSAVRKEKRIITMQEREEARDKEMGGLIEVSNS